MLWNSRRFRQASSLTSNGHSNIFTAVATYLATFGLLNTTVLLEGTSESTAQVIRERIASKLYEFAIDEVVVPKVEV